MSNPKKPEFKGPATQAQALEEFRPQGFYSPYGNIQYGDGGYRAELDSPYYQPETVDQYQDLRRRLISDISGGVSDDTRLDEYTNAFLDKSLEFSAPRLKAQLYGRGQAGSRVGAEATAELINKASTDAVLSRRQLQDLDDKLQLAQLEATERGITGDLARTTAQTGQLIQGAGASEGARSRSISEANAYRQALNELEAERFQRQESRPSGLQQGLDYALQAAKIAAMFTPAAPAVAAGEIAGGVGGQVSASPQFGNVWSPPRYTPQRVATAF